jgi:hypothetical protein
MHIRLRVSMTLISAVFLISVIAAQASARRLELSNQTFRIVWTSVTIRAALQTVVCPLTVEGSFHSRTLAKVAESLVGYITRAITRRESCTGTTEFNIGTEKLPWHIDYAAFAGTLPNITSVTADIIEWHWWYRGPMNEFCFFWYRVVRPIRAFLQRTAEGVMRTARFDETRLSPAPEGTCILEETTVSGTGEVFVLGSTTSRVSMRLVV